MNLHIPPALLFLTLLAPSTSAESWESSRDRVQLAAEEGERRGHPWAGVYSATSDLDPFATLCLAPNGDFYAASYARRERTGQATGRLAYDEGTLRLSTTTRDGRIGEHATGTFRVLRWGDARCLLAAGDEPRFLDCMATRCDQRFLCTRGLLRGHPEFSAEVEKARLAHPMHRAFVVEAVEPPVKRSWGLQYRVRIAGGKADGFKKDDRLYWADDDAWLSLVEVGQDSSIGDMQLPYTNRSGRPGPGVRPGSRIYRWTLRYELMPEFLKDTARIDPAGH